MNDIRGYAQCQDKQIKRVYNTGMTRIISMPQDMDQIRTYVEAGCDLIMIGERFHSARCNGIFNVEELPEAVKLIHEMGAEAGIMMNRLYMQDEVHLVPEYLKQIQEWGFDVIYYNDPAVYVWAKKLGIENHLMYQPDTLMTNSMDVQFMLDRGIQCVMLSKEMTCEEMKEIAMKVKGHIGVIIHGYLNMSYSKRKMLTNYFKVLGEERRFEREDLVLIESTREGRMPVYEDDKGTHIFTDYMLEGFAEVKQLVDAGVQDLMVESLFMQCDEVCDAIRGYKDILNGADAGEIEKAYRAAHDLPLSDGYMYQKTNLVK